MHMQSTRARTSNTQKGGSTRLPGAAVGDPKTCFDCSRNQRLKRICHAKYFEKP